MVVSNSEGSKIVMYATSWCGYCARARQLLASKGQAWEEIDLDQQPGRREEMIEKSGRTSVPQIWIGERHVGGYDDLVALEAARELDPLLAGEDRADG
jgi:glutaredoxin 3